MVLWCSRCCTSTAALAAPQHPQHRVGDRGRGVLVGDAPLVSLPPPADLRLRRSQETLNKFLDGGAGLQQPERLAGRRLAVPPREGLDGPLIFASNHQSYLDTPVIMAALTRRWRYRLAPAMSKEFFTAHFFPKGHGAMRRLATSAAYYLAALLFNAFPLPQREAGARQSLRYMGELVEDGLSILIFPEGHHTDTGRVPSSTPRPRTTALPSVA